MRHYYYNDNVTRYTRGAHHYPNGRVVFNRRRRSRFRFIPRSSRSWSRSPSSSRSSWTYRFSSPSSSVARARLRSYELLRVPASVAPTPPPVPAISSRRAAIRAAWAASLGLSGVSELPPAPVPRPRRRPLPRWIESSSVSTPSVRPPPSFARSEIEFVSPPRPTVREVLDGFRYETVDGVRGIRHLDDEEWEPLLL